MDENTKYKLSIIGDDGYVFERKITKIEADKIGMLVMSGGLDEQTISAGTPVHGEKIVKTKLRRKGSSKKKMFERVEVREPVSSMVLDPHSPEYGDYWSMPTKGVRILWLLAEAKKNGLESLYQKEISILSTKVGDQIETKFITPLILPHRKAQRLVDFPDNKGNRMVRILHPGEDFLKTGGFKKQGGVAESE